MRVGGADLIDVDFRLVAATNRDLEKAVEEGRFRQDLYYRLKVVTLTLPPLRKRGGDLALLSEHYLDRFCEQEEKSPKRLTTAAMDALARHDWPGNVRELRNLMESLVIFHQGEAIDVGDLPAEFRGEEDGPPSGVVQAAGGAPRSMADIERQAILETLELTGGNRAEAAKVLAIGLRTLQRKLKEYRDEGHV